MLIFSAKARQVVDGAVAALSDPSQQSIWQGWAEQHPRVRRPGDPIDDGSGPLPNDVTGVILVALERVVSDLHQQRLRGEFPEDEVYVLDNDLSLVKSVERAVYQNLELYRR
jgi:hypothetical protein